jgi:hypothetical protein
VDGFVVGMAALEVAAIVTAEVMDAMENIIHNSS